MEKLSDAAEQLLKGVLELPQSEQVELAATVFETLKDSGESAEVDWRAELHKRRDEILNGSRRPVSWSELRKELGLVSNDVAETH